MKRCKKCNIIWNEGEKACWNCDSTLYKGVGVDESRLFYFKRVRTKKEGWEDATCQNCDDDLWEQGKIKYAWILKKVPVNIWIQLCDRCFELL